MTKGLRIRRTPAICLLIVFLIGVNLVWICSGREGLPYTIPLQRFASGPKSVQETSSGDRSKRDISGAPNLHGQSGEGYYMAVNVGTPPQSLNVLLDTGSSNFAIAAYGDPLITEFFHRDQSSTYQEVGTQVSVPYTQGKWQGILGTDLVMMESLANITIRPNIAFITSSKNFFINGSSWQGIVGFAYQSIARPDRSLVPFFDTLVSQGGIKNLFSMQLCGSGLRGNLSSLPIDGTLVVGGIQSSLYEGELFYTPVVKEWYYEVVITDIAIDGESLGMDCKEYNYDKTIVDSGTTNLRLPQKVFVAAVDSIKKKLKTKFLARMPVDAFWTGGEVLCWNDPTIPYVSFPLLSLSLVSSNGSSFRLQITPQQYLRTIEEESMENPAGTCFKFGLASSTSGTVMGAIFMEGFYVVFDRANKRIGFAKTTCPAIIPSLPFSEPVVQGPFHTEGSIQLCMYQKPSHDVSTLMITAYIMAGVCGLCLLPLIILSIQWQWRQCRRRDSDDRSDAGSLVSNRSDT